MAIGWVVVAMWIEIAALGYGGSVDCVRIQRTREVRRRQSAQLGKGIIRIELVEWEHRNE
jgi:hypothetical protein